MMAEADTTAAIAHEERAATRIVQGHQDAERHFDPAAATAPASELPSLPVSGEARSEPGPELDAPPPPCARATAR